jgi:hypothetical protein
VAFPAGTVVRENLIRTKVSANLIPIRTLSLDRALDLIRTPNRVIRNRRVTR